MRKSRQGSCRAWKGGTITGVPVEEHAASAAADGGEPPASGEPTLRVSGPLPRSRPSTGAGTRRVPERTCVACRETAGKRELVRVVRTVAGPVEVDLTGRKNGRGAYLHADPACWDMAFKRQTLNGALKTVVGGDDLAALQEFRDLLVAGDAGVAAVPLAAVAARVASGASAPRGSRRQGRGGGVKPATAKSGPVSGGRA